MSELKVFNEDQPGKPVRHWHEHNDIANELSSVGVRFEQWNANEPVSASDHHDAIISAYKHEIVRLIALEGYKSVDVVALSPDNPDKDFLRKKFLSEHTHSDDEVRFFVAGQGLFSMRIDGYVYETLCEKGDLIDIPAETRHWFDMGPNPEFVAIRLFNDPKGWVANYTGSAIADTFSRLEN